MPTEITLNMSDLDGQKASQKSQSLTFKFFFASIILNIEILRQRNKRKITNTVHKNIYKTFI